MVSLNMSLSSAFLMVSACAPMSLTPDLSKKPDSDSAMAILSPAWPPRVGSTASGFSLRISCSTVSGVRGSIYTRSAMR